MKILTRKCNECRKVYFKKPNIGLPDWKAGKSKYCSKECQIKSLVGKPTWNKGIRTGIITKGAWKKGYKPWHKGTKGKSAHGENHGRWKGKKVSYSGLHYWVARWKGRPKKCEICGTTTAKKYEWANLDHKYQRILKNYKRMCTSCHRKHDLKYAGK
jgi:hypothetical protein